MFSTRLTAARTLAAVGVGCLATLLLAHSAHAARYTIETSRYIVRQLGPFDTHHSRSYAPTVERAIDALGTPSNLFRPNGYSCVVKWRRLGLRIEFHNYYSPGDDCEFGLAQRFTIEKSRKWRTWKGLRIGMTEAQLLDRHPRAEWVPKDSFPSAWWLRDAYSPIGDGGDYPVLYARLKHGDEGRVASFYGWIGAAGE
jgi:hypothetical protein